MSNFLNFWIILDRIVLKPASGLGLVDLTQFINDFKRIDSTKINTFEIT